MLPGTFKKNILKKKKLSISSVAWLIAAGSGIIILAVSLYLYFDSSGASIYLLAGLPAGSVIIIYFITGFILNRFLKDQMSPVFEPVNDIVHSKSHIPDNSDKDIISEVEEEVHDWAEERKKEVEKLKDLENYRKEFLGNVYHELKTPIFNMQGYILTLLEGGIHDKSIKRLYLERAEKNINRMISIVEDLETISRLESGAMNLNIDKFDIRKTVEEVFEANEIRALEQKIRLEMEPAEGEQLIVKGDRKRIYQVLNNLVINSINYGIRNGKTTVSLSVKGEKIVIEIKDTGIGIGKSDAKRIFERFYRVDKSRSRDSGGTGLGLSIVKHIVEAHKQKVKLTSIPGEGSTFSFALDRG